MSYHSYLILQLQMVADGEIVDKMCNCCQEELYVFVLFSISMASGAMCLCLFCGTAHMSR